MWPRPLARRLAAPALPSLPLSSGGLAHLAIGQSRVPLPTLERSSGDLDRPCLAGRRPDPEFIKETLAAFPDKGIATVEEARVSLRLGCRNGKAGIVGDDGATRCGTALLHARPMMPMNM